MAKTTLLIATFLCALTSPALAQQAPTQQAPTQQQMPAGQQGQRQSPFERADANSDGVITRDEVRTARTEAFNRLDANRDSFLVREEMRQRHMEPRQNGISDGGHRMKKKSGAYLLGRADANNDGSITRAEFVAASNALQQANASAMTAQREQIFARLDTNRDGTITRAEMDAGRDQVREGRPAQGQNGAGPMGQATRPNNPDTNNDQKVSLAEWLARPDPLFDRGDANNDGRVTREEAAAIVRQGRSNVRSAKRPW